MALRGLVLGGLVLGVEEMAENTVAENFRFMICASLNEYPGSLRLGRKAKEDRRRVMNSKNQED